MSSDVHREKPPTLTSNNFALASNNFVLASDKFASQDKLFSLTKQNYIRLVLSPIIYQTLSLLKLNNVDNM
jgi:hypothetical protein